MEIIRFPLERHGGSNSSDEDCYVCGRKLRAVRHWIHVGNGGGWAVTDAEAAADPGGDLGMQAIGPCCLRARPEMQPFARRDLP